MTQQFPTSAQAIYEVLSADATFVALLGTYDFRAGSQLVTALSIVSAGQDMPAVRKVSGLECIIQDAGDSTAQNYLTGAPDIITTWSLFLVAWEPSKGSGLQLATDHILRRFVGARAVQTVAASDGLGALVQNKVFIQSNMPIRTL